MARLKYYIKHKYYNEIIAAIVVVIAVVLVSKKQVYLTNDVTSGCS